MPDKTSSVSRVASAFAQLKKEGAKQKLMTSQIRKLLPPLYTQENEKDPTVYVKFFNPYGAGTWLVTEFDGRDTMFGYVMGLGGNEWGYISLRELEQLPAIIGGKRMPFQGIERDAWFKPMPFSRTRLMASERRCRAEHGRPSHHIIRTCTIGIRGISNSSTMWLIFMCRQ